MSGKFKIYAKSILFFAEIFTHMHETYIFDF